MDPIVYQGAIGVIVPWILERLKSWQRFVPPRYVATVSRFLSAGIALATAAGFQLQASGSSACLVVPEGSTIVDLAVRTVVQYAIHEFTYRVAINAPRPAGAA